VSAPLNEMKVAAALLRGQIHEHMVESIGDSQDTVALLEDMELIAWHLAEARHLWREGAVQAITAIVAAAAGLNDLRDEEEGL